MKGISVIICCFNSASRIVETLRNLLLQKTDESFLWEIIIVDNASTDGTANVALRFWADSKGRIELRVISEPQPGLVYARIAGVKNAAYDIVVFCDDDNWLFENYIQTAFDIMQSDVSIGAVGGQGIARSESRIPDWFDKFKGYYACYEQAEKTGELTEPLAFLFGAGLVIRKRALKTIYSPDLKLLTTGRTGKSFMSGDDNELSYLLRLAGYRLWYDDRLKFYHFLPKQRLDHDYRSKLVNGVAYSSMRLILYQYVLSGRKVTRITWLLDVFVRMRHVLSACVMIHRSNDNEASFSVAWSAMRGIIDQFGRYRRDYNEIVKYKCMNKLPPWEAGF